MHPDLSRPPRARPRLARYLSFVAAVWLVAAAVVMGAQAGPLAPTAAAGTPSGLTWSRLSPPDRPPALQDATAAYDGADQTVVLFGGRLTDGRLSDQTWVWNGSTWTSATPDGASPPPREQASMAFDAHLDQLILFGGEGAGGQLLDDTWAWNGASWTPVTTARTPGGREGAALASDADGHLVLFGGYGTSNGSPPPRTTTTTTRPAPRKHKRRHDHKPASTTTTTAPRKSTTTTTTTGPPKSTTTTTTPATTAPSSTTTTTLPGTGSSSTTTTTLPTAGPAAPVVAPSTTTATSARSSRRETVRLTAASTGARVLGDTWILGQAADGGDQWTQVVTPSAPPPRADAALSAGTGDQTILFGGSAVGPDARQQSALRGDTWIWNGRRWSEPKLSTHPSPRVLSDFQDAAGPGGLGNAVLFGGLGRTGALDDTWRWDGHGWQRLSPASPASARSGAAAAYDQVDAQYVLFGGKSAGGQLLSDTQVLTPHPPQHVVTSPAQSGGGGAPTGGGSGHGGGSIGSGRAGSSPRGSGSISTSGSTPLTEEARVHRGAVITVTGSGFRPGTLVTITFHSKPQIISKVHATATGAFLANVVVPVGAAPGAHHIVATGLDPDGQMHELRIAVEVVAVLAHGVAEWAQATMVAIAIAIPVVSWFAIGLFSRRRLVHRP